MVRECRAVPVRRGVARPRCRCAQNRPSPGLPRATTHRTPRSGAPRSAARRLCTTTTANAVQGMPEPCPHTCPRPCPCQPGPPPLTARRAPPPATPVAGREARCAVVVGPPLGSGAVQVLVAAAPHEIGVLHEAAVEQVADVAGQRLLRAGARGGLKAREAGAAGRARAARSGAALLSQSPPQPIPPPLVQRPHRAVVVINIYLACAYVLVVFNPLTQVFPALIFDDGADGKVTGVGRWWRVEDEGQGARRSGEEDLAAAARPRAAVRCRLQQRWIAGTGALHASGIGPKRGSGRAARSFAARLPVRPVRRARADGVLQPPPRA
jgi:hypothetical protein